MCFLHFSTVVKRKENMYIRARQSRLSSFLFVFFNWFYPYLYAARDFQQLSLTSGSV